VCIWKIIKNYSKASKIMKDKNIEKTVFKLLNEFNELFPD